jgi:hypothetical protein
MTRNFWRNAFLAAMMVSFVSAMPVVAVAAGFFQSIDDLPVAPGLTENVDQGVVFDSPAGRIVTAIAESGADGEVDIAAVRAFYRKALPPLGWSAVSAQIYTREGERLTLRVERAGKRTILRVRLVPAEAR